MARVSSRTLGVRELALERGAAVVGFEQREQEPADRGLVALRAVRLALEQPAAELVVAGVGDRVGAAAARALADDLDHPGLVQPGELGIDLAVARVPCRGHRDARTCCASSYPVPGGDGEHAEERVAEGHTSQSIMTCRA